MPDAALSPSTRSTPLRAALPLAAGLFILCLLVSVAPAAYADDSVPAQDLPTPATQDAAKKPKVFALKLGIFQRIDTGSPAVVYAFTTADTFSEPQRSPVNAFFLAGVTVDLPTAGQKREGAPRLLLSAYGDIFSGKRQKETNYTYDASIGGLGVAGRAVLAGRGSALAPYVGLGAGVYHVRYRSHFNFDDFNDTAKETGIGGKLFVGLEGKSGFLFEITYHDLPKPDGINSDGLSAQVGFRF